MKDLENTDFNRFEFDYSEIIDWLYKSCDDKINLIIEVRAAADPFKPSPNLKNNGEFNSVAWTVMPIYDF